MLFFVDYPVIKIYLFFSIAYHAVEVNEANRRKKAGWTIMVTCIGVLVLTSAASSVSLYRWVVYFYGDYFWFHCMRKGVLCLK